MEEVRTRLEAAERLASEAKTAQSQHEVLCVLRWDQVKKSSERIESDLKEMKEILAVLMRKTAERDGVMRAATYGVAVITAITGALGALAAYIFHK